MCQSVNTMTNLFSYQGMLKMKLQMMKESRSISWKDLLDHFSINWLLTPFHHSRGFWIRLSLLNTSVFSKER